MPLICADAVTAIIMPWTPLPEIPRGQWRGPLEYERDRCQRPECRKLAWQHRAVL
jgi:hypothetical protein